MKLTPYVLRQRWRVSKFHSQMAPDKIHSHEPEKARLSEGNPVISVPQILIWTVQGDTTPQRKDCNTISAHKT